MKVERSLDSIYIYIEQEDLMPFMLRIAKRMFTEEDDYIKSVVLWNEWELRPNEDNYKKLMDQLDVHEMIHIMSHDEALKLSDELVTALFANEKPQEANARNLKLARICVTCGKGYISEKKGHDECI